MRPVGETHEMRIFLTSQQSACFSKRTLYHWAYSKDTGLKSVFLHCFLHALLTQSKNPVKTLEQILSAYKFCYRYVCCKRFPCSLPLNLMFMPTQLGRQRLVDIMCSAKVRLVQK